MTKSRVGFSAAAAFAIFIFTSFTPGALGQGTVGGAIRSGVAQTSVSQLSAGLLVLGFEPGAEQRHREPAPPSNGCGNKNGGWNQRCSAVPEGGSTFGYLALVGLCCVATAIFSIRRQARVRVTK